MDQSNPPEIVLLGSYQLTPRPVEDVVLYAPKDFWSLSKDECLRRVYG